MPAPNPLFLRDEAVDQGLELLFHAQTALAQAARAALERHRLSPAEHRVLYLIERHPGVTLAELGNALGVTKQSLSRLVKGLARRALVVQEATAADRRKRLLRVSPAAEILVREITAAQRRPLRLAFREAGGGAVDGLRQVLAGLIEDPLRRGRRGPA